MKNAILVFALMVVGMFSTACATRNYEAVKVTKKVDGDVVLCDGTLVKGVNKETVVYEGPRDLVRQTIAGGSYQTYDAMSGQPIIEPTPYFGGDARPRRTKGPEEIFHPFVDRGGVRGWRYSPRHR